jgi:RHS repeat-associated protein
MELLPLLPVAVQLVALGEAIVAMADQLLNEARLNMPYGVAIDTAGNLYIADLYNHRIRRVDTNGIITTFAGIGTPGYGGDGGPVTQAQLNGPVDVTLDAQGNLYIADADNGRIRKVDTNGIITTVAGTTPWSYGGDGGPAIQAGFDFPFGVAVDASGNIYVADVWGYRVRKIDADGIITTVAGDGEWGYGGDGGPATQAQLDEPNSVVLDAQGNLYIADSYNSRIRKVYTNGIITTIAGSGGWTNSGDGGPATEADFYSPTGLAVTQSGTLYIADVDWHNIRKVAPPTGVTDFFSGDNIPFADENGLGYIMASSGRHKQTIDLDTGKVLYEFGYNENKQLVSITDRFGNQTTINRDGSGVPLSITSPEGIITTLTIDENNHLTGITYPDGSSYGFEYAPGGLMTAKTEPEGNRFEQIYNATGRITDASDEEGGHSQYSRAAQANGDILTEYLTAEGDKTSYLDHYYSTGAYTSTITRPTGAQIQYARSADGLSVNKSLPCGMEYAFQYDVDREYGFQYVKGMWEDTPGGLQRVTQRAKTYQDTDADEVPDRITEQVTVNNKATALVNDTLASTRTLTSPAGRTVTTLYDPDTLLTNTLSIPGLFDTNYGYDTKGRLTSITTNTRETSFTYNSQGFLESITDPENYTTSYSYDDVGRMTGIFRPEGSSIGFDYDQNGNMTVLTTPSTIDHGFGYNRVNLNSTYQAPISGTYSYVYDRDRRLTQINFPSGLQINNIYNNGRLAQIQTPEGNIDFTYYCANMVESITKGAEAITYGYDGQLVTSETLNGTLNQTLGYTYNNDFSLTSFTYAGGTTSYAYDNDGLLTGAGAFTITRDANNGLPTAATGGALSLTRAFNGYGEVEGQDYTVNSNSLTSWSLTRDDTGRITQKQETVGGTTSNYAYTYDPMGRLLTVTKDGALVEEYQYGPNGTRTFEMNTLRGISGRSFAYSDEDHLLQAGSTTYQYDADGFLVTKTEGTNMTQYAYSSRGELLQVVLPDGKTIDYLHDPLGRRIAKIVDGVITEKYLWQGLTRLLALYDGSDNLVMRFEYADGRMPVSLTKGGITYYLTYDQVGSLRVITNSSGNVIKRADYDSFGNIINDSDPSFEIPFGFAGGLRDLDTDLVHFGFRDYDPDIGRWTAKDPIGFGGSDTDLYAYCWNDPVNWVDRMGLDVFIVIIRNRGSSTTGATTGTFSVMSTSGAGPSFIYTGYTLEPPSGGDDPKIAAGTYSAYQRETSSEGETYDPPRLQLEDVQSEACIDMPGAQIHIGNELSETEGCILVGQLPSMDGQPNTVGDSTNALQWINDIINTDGGNITVIIID